MSCRITVAGPLGVAATRAVRAQYGHVVLSTREPGRHTVLTLDSLDQPALRSLLTLLWDFGHDVIAVSTRTVHSRTMEQIP
ncbi:hypothetical protein AB0M20_30530 [Actinoplanes sp. NPDC051633]|uniref:hypothetical protein n=1 Tax=Actinoplanes sp. NPDC051633 TaxID=3155670 RepID=UPI00341E0D8F